MVGIYGVVVPRDRTSTACWADTGEINSGKNNKLSK